MALQKLTYLEEAVFYDDYTIPPLNQTLEETEAEFRDQLVIKTTLEGTIIGSVRISVGLVSDFADIYHFLQFAGGFIDERAEHTERELDRAHA
jgi:hypothetical protein